MLYTVSIRILLKVYTPSSIVSGSLARADVVEVSTGGGAATFSAVMGLLTTWLRAWIFTALREGANAAAPVTRVKTRESFMVSLWYHSWSFCEFMEFGV